MLFELLTGKPPFVGRGLTEVLSGHLESPAPPVRDRRPDAPPALADLVARMLAKQTRARPTAAAVRKTLADLDPEILGPRERKRQTRAKTHTGDDEPPPEGQISAPTRLVIIGDNSDYLVLALSVSGIEATICDRLEQVAEPPDAVFMRGATPEAIAALGPDQPPILADATAGDIDRITALRRAGVAAIVNRPVSPDELARKVKRVVRKRRAEVAALGQ